MNNNLIPILPMKDIIIFPQMIAPVFILKSQSTEAIDNALLTENKEILLLALRDTHIEQPEISDIYEAGVFGKIVQNLKFPDGSIRVLIEGIKRIKIHDAQKENDLILAHYEELNDISPESADEKALIKVTLDGFNTYLQKITKISPENFISINEINEAGKLADTMVTFLSIGIQDKQDVLESLNTYERLEKVSKILSKEIELVGIEESIQEKIKYRLGKTQKEFLLREKLQAIKDELGSEGGENEVAEYKQAIEKSKIPANVKEQLNKEISRLERMPGYTPETSVIRTYLETVLGLPWCKRSKDMLDIERAKTILDEDHYGLKDVKERILEFLAVKKLSNGQQPTIICFTGPPGVGKTSLAKSVARSLNRNFSQVSLGGINDESEIRGHRRTYIGSMPGRIIRAVQDAGTKNPVILLDEIEKMLPSHMGDPTAAMLEVLDPAQNSHYTDHYIDLPFDLSEVFFIATANTTENLYKPLKDRMETISIAGYTEGEKINIAEKFLVPRQFKSNGIDLSKLEITNSALSEIVNKYTREAGVRELERSIAKICRKFAVELLTIPETTVQIIPDNLEKYLGSPKFIREEAVKEAQVGLVHGLAWTEFGGEILEIEASIMPGKGRLNLTGRLGEVMQESAKTAFSYARSNYKVLNLPPDIQDKYDIHVHAVDGATPKDGPSAGIALTVAIISALTERAVRSDIAMTGEITLRGRILPIGGLKEKCIASLRNDITKVIIPKGNEKDIKDLPDYIKNKIDFTVVNNLNEVIDFVLLEAIAKQEHNGKSHNDGLKKVQGKIKIENQ